MEEWEAPQIRVYEPQPGDRFIISMDSVDITVLNLISDGNIKPLSVKEVKTKHKFLPFIKKKRKTLEFEMITSIVKENKND